MSKLKQNLTLFNNISKAHLKIQYAKTKQKQIL